MPVDKSWLQYENFVYLYPILCSAVFGVCSFPGKILSFVTGGSCDMLVYIWNYYKNSRRFIFTTQVITVKIYTCFRSCWCLSFSIICRGLPSFCFILLTLFILVSLHKHQNNCTGRIFICQYLDIGRWRFYSVAFHLHYWVTFLIISVFWLWIVCFVQMLDIYYMYNNTYCILRQLCIIVIIN
jgi:hypothetical protein